jgi:hypothetical protein
MKEWPYKRDPWSTKPDKTAWRWTLAVFLLIIALLCLAVWVCPKSPIG